MTMMEILETGEVVQCICVSDKDLVFPLNSGGGGGVCAGDGGLSKHIKAV